MLKYFFTITIFFTLLTALSLQAQNIKKEAFFKDKTKLKNPFALRDPFKSPSFERKVDKRSKLGSDGVFSNIPTIESVPLANIKITGVFVGKERRALAKINDKDTVILKEGMRLGADRAELKAIMPGGVVLVEKIINVYGQEEYLETVIPISNQ